MKRRAYGSDNQPFPPELEEVHGHSLASQEPYYQGARMQISARGDWGTGGGIYRSYAESQSSLAQAKPSASEVRGEGMLDAQIHTHTGL